MFILFEFNDRKSMNGLLEELSSIRINSFLVGDDTVNAQFE